MGAWEETTEHLLQELFGEAGEGEVGFRFWDGTSWPDERDRRAWVVLNHPGTLRSALMPGSELGVGEGYVKNDFDIEGDIEAVFEVAETLVDKVPGLSARLRLRRELKRLPRVKDSPSVSPNRARLTGRPHSPGRNRLAISHHYDVSNDFYALWLDKNMVYSCAYFTDPSVSLEAAQQGKLDLICRKLRLGPDRRLLDIGCGWGGLLVHASQRHEVKAEGITLSAAQAEMATERIARGELEPSCRVNVRDYRDVDARGQYDALVSVGMFEHVGEAELEGYFEQARGLLKPGGLFLNHGIARNYHHFVGRGRSFAAHHVFPDGELVPLSTTLKVAEKAGFEVRDVESLREHYALTLRHWVRRLEERHEEALQVVDESVYRVWRLYMAGAAHGFRTGRMSVYQVLLSKPGPGGETGLPLTRHHMLCGRDSS